MFSIPLDMNHFHIYWTKYLQVNIASQGWKLAQSTGSESQHCTELVSSNLCCLYPIFVYFFWQCNTSHPILGSKVFGRGAKWQFCLHSQTRSDNRDPPGDGNWRLNVCFAYQYFQDRSCTCFNTSPQSHQFSRSVVSDSASPWTAAHQASLSNSRNLLKRVLYRLLKVSWSLNSSWSVPHQPCVPTEQSPGLGLEALAPIQPSFQFSIFTTTGSFRLF